MSFRTLPAFDDLVSEGSQLDLGSSQFGGHQHPSALQVVVSRRGALWRRKAVSTRTHRRRSRRATDTVRNRASPQGIHIPGRVGSGLGC
jgi:hypothetical protein